MNECAIEWVKQSDTAGVTAYSNSRLKSKLLKYAESHPNECKIIAENEDGSIFAHVPVKWIKVSPTKKVSDEQRAAAAERLAKARSKK